jgi:hypothetical protein
MHGACSKVKHFDEFNASGDYLVTEGGWGQVVNIGGAMNNATSSATYSGPVNA